MSEKKTSSRIIALDLMRGYFLVSIVLDHLYWFPNGFDWVSARGNLFVSAAEGFFLISGIVLGIVRGQKYADKAFSIGAKLLLKRSVQLYITSIVLMLIFTFLGWGFFMDNPGLKPGIRPIDQPLLEVLRGAFTYEYIYGWADFLRLYAIFIFLSPIALWLLRKGKWYIVIALNVLFYMSLPLFDRYTHYSVELLMPVTWQLIFFSGFVIGFHQKTIASWWHSLSARLRQSIQVSLVSIAAITILANVILVFGADMSETLSAAQATLAPHFDKQTLPVARLVLFTIWFFAGFWLFRRYESQINKWFGWILLPYGVNSLYVYTIHAFVIFFIHMLMLGASKNFLINLIGTMLVLGIILLAVRTKFLMKIIPR